MRVLAGAVFLLVSQILPAQQPAKPAASAATESQPSTAAPCAQPASAAQVRRLMELAGSKKLMASVLDTTGRHLFEDLQKVRPDVPTRAWDAALARLESPQVLQGLLDQVVPIYQRHFCADEVEQLIEFYQTPAGRKLSAEMPAIQKEAAEAGRNYMASISGELLRDVQQALKQGGKTPPTPAKPSQPAVFILSSGERLESSHYLVSSDSVQVEQGDTQRTIPLSALNVDATIAANRARGIDLKIPARGQIMLGF
jgi:hypothetical protein